MELVVCFGLAVSAFILLVVGIIGLVSAPTPILVVILITGVVLTQKSINKSTEADFNLVEDKDKTEQVEIASVDDSVMQEREKIKSMTYRGKSYHLHHKSDRTNNHRTEVTIQYRGAKLVHHKPENV